ncbi:MAG: 6-bladed beta-propeller [Gemmatimonadaceae bacterium]
MKPGEQMHGAIRSLAVGCLIAATVATDVLAQPKVAEWKLTPTFVVGDGANDIVLERVNSVQLHKTGRLLIADGGAKTIFVVDSSGKALPQIGRTGAGPAEYRTPYALATIGDTIAVLDPSNARIGLFNSKGEWQGQWISPQITGSDVRLFRMPGAQFYNYGTRRDGDRSSTTFVRYDSKGARDTVVPPPMPSSELGVVCRMTNAISFFNSVFEPRRIRVPAPGNSFLDATTDNYKVVQNASGGAPIATFIGTAPRLPISDTEWEASIKGWTKFQKENTTSGCNHSTITRPATKPAMRAMWWDDSGRLWIERYAAKGFAFDIFNAKGVQVATIPAPEREAGVEPTVVGNRMALLALNADGAQVVRVYRFGAGK